MQITNPQISKKMFKTFFGIFLSLSIIFIIFFIYATYIGIKNDWGGESIFLILPMFLMLCFCIALLITFLVLLIINKKRDNKKRFLTIAALAIILEIIAIAFVFVMFKEDKNKMTYENLRTAECVAAKNAKSYQDCASMISDCIGSCIKTVGEKIYDFDECINLSIEYAKSGIKCSRGGYTEDNPECQKGFNCIKKNNNQSDIIKDEVCNGYSDGTYKCEVYIP